MEHRPIFAAKNGDWKGQCMTVDGAASIQADQSAYKAYFDGGVSTLMSQMWGGNLHMGCFAEPNEPLADAQLRAKRIVAELLNLASGRTLIEVACGVGTTAIFLAKQTGARIDATNISETQLAEARTRASEAGLANQITFAFGDYHLLDAPANSRDSWLCQEALLYAQDRHQVFAEARRVVRPGGRIVFTDLTLSDSLSPEERSAFMSDIRAPHFWSLDKYDDFVRESGLTLIARHDWGLHAMHTFAAVAENIREKREVLTGLVGEDAVSQAEFRIDRQYRMAKTGDLGWCVFCLEVA